MSAALTLVDDFAAAPRAGSTTRAWASRPDATVITYSRAAPYAWRAAVNNEIEQRLRALLHLRRGWDGHDGRPVTPAVAEFAFGLLQQLMRLGLPAPSLMPLSDGSLQIEWHRKGWDIEIEIPQPNAIRLWALELATGREHERAMGANVGPLLTFIDRICD